MAPAIAVAANAHNNPPMTRVAIRSLRWSPPPLAAGRPRDPPQNRQKTIKAEVTSMSESTPNPNSEIDSSPAPYPIATPPSTKLYTTVKSARTRASLIHWSRVHFEPLSVHWLDKHRCFRAHGNCGGGRADGWNGPSLLRSRWTATHRPQMQRAHAAHRASHRGAPGSSVGAAQMQADAQHAHTHTLQDRQGAPRRAGREDTMLDPWTAPHPPAVVAEATVPRGESAVRTSSTTDAGSCRAADITLLSDSGSHPSFALWSSSASVGWAGACRTADWSTSPRAVPAPSGEVTDCDASSARGLERAAASMTGRDVTGAAAPAAAAEALRAEAGGGTAGGGIRAGGGTRRRGDKASSARVPAETGTSETETVPQLVSVTGENPARSSSGEAD
mmetsp:Transcript_3477/g.8294  ORF Transcript_3477/g.8294 Transcript_3477/m.8294 type:complete len:389 (+) Transcript_3477:552-1718(+)